MIHAVSGQVPCSRSSDHDFKIAVECEPANSTKNRFSLDMVWALSSMKIDRNRILDGIIHNIWPMVGLLP